MKSYAALILVLISIGTVKSENTSVLIEYNFDYEKSTSNSSQNQKCETEKCIRICGGNENLQLNVSVGGDEFKVINLADSNSNFTTINEELTCPETHFEGEADKFEFYEVNYTMYIYVPYTKPMAIWNIFQNGSATAHGELFEPGSFCINNSDIQPYLIVCFENYEESVSSHIVVYGWYI